MLQETRHAALLAAMLSLAACSSLEESLEGKVDYKGQAARQLPQNLEVPPDLTAPPRDNRYVVPETGRSSATLSGYQAERKEQGRAPGTTTVLPVVENMRIERAGAERWLVVQEPPEKVWPQVKAFWQEAGFLIRIELPEAGIMETDWAENRAVISEGGLRNLLGRLLDQVSSTAERDKFRTRLERTPEGKGTEVYVSHRGMRETVSTPRDVTGTSVQTVWEPRDPDSGLEAEFLRRLMVKLGAQQDQAKHLVASAAAPPPQRASIGKRLDGQAMLQVYEPFDRAWRRVGLALDRVGFTVEDRDRQKGLYFVRYADPEAEMEKKNAERGFFGRLFGSSSTPKPEQYRVQVVQIGNDVEVNVLNKDGGVETSKTGQRILGLLHEQLK
jgi:outer membrane protein assembly factor BamC